MAVKEGDWFCNFLGLIKEGHIFSVNVLPSLSGGGSCCSATWLGVLPATSLVFKSLMLVKNVEDVLASLCFGVF